MDGSKDNAARDEAMPYGVDTIRLRISFPAAPVSRGYNGRMWRMRPLRGWTGGAEWDAREATKRSGDRDGSVAAGQDHAPAFPGGGQAVPASQAVEGGGPASELLAAFRAQRMGALQGRGLAANGVDAPGTAGRDGNGPGSAPSMPFAVLPRLDVTPPGASITPSDPAPYASSDLRGQHGAPGTGRAHAASARHCRSVARHHAHAGAATDRYVDALNQAMTAHGINTPAQRAAFLAQVSVESNQLRNTAEDLNYTTVQRLQEVYGSRLFPTPASAAPYLNNPEGLANHVYANRNGNGDEASGDGWRYGG